MIVLRQGRPEDTEAVQELLQVTGMGTGVDPCECLLAKEAGVLAGLARVEYGAGIPYLRPIAIAPAYRRRGVGRRLLCALVAERGQLWVVARGAAVGFYHELGFVPMDWDAVYAPYRQECVECPDREECAPMPMRYSAPRVDGIPFGHPRASDVREHGQRIVGRTHP